MFGEVLASAALAQFTSPASRPMVLKTGQAYWLAGFRMHETKTGRRVLLHRWTTLCATCGAQFETADKSPTPEHLTRNCLAHRRRRLAE